MDSSALTHLSSVTRIFVGENETNMDTGMFEVLTHSFLNERLEYLCSGGGTAVVVVVVVAVVVVVL
ncbi:hypothetical protein E2C01_054124 [Portunus trituberculatus]|uniref:Uncharacterized protein n=1 Tax=Portunus trituberculatus TaxID=210409 RepID=A0A5B7GSB8_PORTR|nr:hypothetical protein [Portunus trituberculatus]